MATINKLRVMVDANVLIAGVGWPRFPYEVLQHAVKRDYQLVLTPFVIDEAKRHITRLFPNTIASFTSVLTTSGYESVATPTKAELAAYSDLMRDEKDIPVALAAIKASVHFLVTQDRDFTDPNEPIHQHLKIILPGTFLREQMGWTSEALEIIRTRTWNDVED